MTPFSYLSPSSLSAYLTVRSSAFYFLSVKVLLRGCQLRQVSPPRLVAEIDVHFAAITILFLPTATVYFFEPMCSIIHILFCSILTSIAGITFTTITSTHATSCGLTIKPCHMPCFSIFLLVLVDVQTCYQQMATCSFVKFARKPNVVDELQSAETKLKKVHALSQYLYTTRCSNPLHGVCVYYHQKKRSSLC
jgi:hypothetical protein